ncbi:YpuI family protein [Mesobacillus maritimus]|uniref:YpuI family protein n=1 Tax=Mesobacillus maritimus TaxID=1643336 RepID=UPI00203E4B68|nr:YpuI family protein [Mesobacillus maritimus]MCM3586455.1 YpuI family protein [Mesobacillus maritimus]MCM3669513.1 YpuI family protein [Mesobacillus maritimus]
MGNTIVETQIHDVKDFLGQTVSKLEGYLNETTLQGLQAEVAGNTEYYKLILSTIRRLSVFCEEGLEACQVIHKAQPFSKVAAEKTLYRIYNYCIEEFFSPKSDAWYEDSRSAYTGKNAIKYRENVPLSLKELIVSLEEDFQRIREELEYYETDYRTKILQSK